MSDKLDKVMEVASEAGIEGDRPEPDLLSFTFEGEGRHQTVYVEHFDEMDNGLNVISFVSPCENLDDPEYDQFDLETAREVLKLNSILDVGQFCIWNDGDHDYLAARATQILETIDPEEFVADTEALAQLADGWEEHLGQDIF